MSYLRIAYASRPAPGIAMPEIMDIVERAREANLDQGISGVLGFDGQRILQILEGPPDAVESLFDRIQRDGRHYGVVELGRATVAKPSYSGWGMAHVGVADVLDAVGAG